MLCANQGEKLEPTSEIYYGGKKDKARLYLICKTNYKVASFQNSQIMKVSVIYTSLKCPLQPWQAITSLTVYNWKKLKAEFLQNLIYFCYKIYRAERVCLSLSDIVKCEIWGNFFKKKRYFGQYCVIKILNLKIILHICDTHKYD